MTDAITLQLPFAMTSQNTLRNWERTRGGQARYRRFRDDMRLMIRHALAKLDVEPAWPRSSARRTDPNGDLFGTARAERVRLEVRRYSKGTLDNGNLVGGCKPLLDAIAREGLIYDDCTEWLDDHYEQHPAKAKEGRTEVEIEVIRG